MWNLCSIVESLEFIFLTIRMHLATLERKRRKEMRESKLLKGKMGVMNLIEMVIALPFYV